MPKFRYTATDAQDRPVSGELSAENIDAAWAQLSASGLKECVCAAAPALQPLSSEEAVELAGQVAEMTKAGLPLGAGLRAMADELSRQPMARAMRAMAHQLDAGMSLDAVIESHGQRLPGHLRGLLLAGHRSGQLPEVLEQLVDLERAGIEMRRRLWLALAYPTLLILLLLGLFLLFSMLIVPACRQVFNDFGADLPTLTRLELSAFATGFDAQVAVAAALAIGLFFLCTTGKPGWAQPVLDGIPIAGSIWRLSRLAAFSRLLALLLDYRLPLPHALRLTADGAEEPELAEACRGAADQVEVGRSLADAMGDYARFPPTLVPLVRWGEQTPRLGEAFWAAAEMFEGRARTRAALLETFVLPLVFLMVIGAIGVMMIGLLLPLISLIQKLT